MENGDVVPIIGRTQTACYENPLFEEDGTLANETHTKLHKQDGIRSKPYDLNNAAQTSVHYKQSKPKKRRLYILGAVIAILAIIAIAVAVIVGQRENATSDRSSASKSSTTSSSSVPIYSTSRQELANVIVKGLDHTLFEIDASSVTLDPKDPALSVITTAKPGVCFPVKSPYCENIVKWDKTTYPNILGHKSPTEAEEAENHYIELVAHNGCGKDFWCTVFNPNCVNNRALPPCRSYCKAVYTSCHYETNISAVLSCDSLPDSDDPNICQQDPFKPGMCHSNVLDDRCKSFGYSEVAFPNFASQRTPYVASEWTLVIDHINNATHCYKYSYMFACYTLLPKCSGSRQVPQHAIPPCRSLCNAFKSRCSIFMDIFWYAWPETLFCDSFPDSSDPNVCLGFAEAHEPPTLEDCPAAEERCDNKTCVPFSWKCDGYQDCQDGSDEAAIQTTMPLRKCVDCPTGMYKCSFESAICIENSRRCDGIEDCPTASDERECVQLGDEGGSEGVVKVHTELGLAYVCVDGWTDEASSIVCEQMGYQSHTSWSAVQVSISRPAFQLKAARNGTDPDYIASRLRSVTSCPGNTVVKVICGHPVCGIRPAYIRPALRVVGGDIADPNAWPWQVSVFGGSDHKYFCGGTIIDKNWILTAGHCLGGRKDPKNMLLRAGQPRRDTYSAYTQDLYPAELILHPEYNLHTVENDIALIRLNNSIRFNDHVRPVCLPKTSEKLPVGRRCTVIGWGKQGDNASTYERQIRQVNLEVTNWDSCKYAVENSPIKVPYRLTDQMFCAGGGLGHDSCSGDSGGPFLCQLDKELDTWFVAGIVSWGVACAYPNVPGVYTNVPGYLGWIRNVTGLQYL